MRMKNYAYQIIVFAIMLTVFSSPTLALLEPSAVYCTSLGYTWTLEKDSQNGICMFGNESCPSTDFLMGKCGTEYSYCSRNGYAIRTVSNQACSSLPFFTECSACVLGNGTEVEVTKLMNLSFEEGSCGDGRCTLGEDCSNCISDCGCPEGRECQNNTCVPALPICGNTICESSENCTTCPQDCGFCKVEVTCGNGSCEPALGENDDSCPQDCKAAAVGTDLILPAAIAVVVIAAGAVILYRRKRGKASVVFQNTFKNQAVSI
jgi:hypothetical protein